jgi:hypothetical protein
MLNALIVCGLVMTAISIPLVFYWKANEVASFLRKLGI